LAFSTNACRHTEVSVSSKLAAIVYHPLNLRTPVNPSDDAFGPLHG
jgi:hypothetical protein